MTFFANRRRMLLGLASATTAAATGVTASGAVAAKEAPELIALADQLDATLAAYLAAVAEVERIAEEWGPRWPVPSEKIQRWTGGSKKYTDILGRPMQLPAPRGNREMRHVNIGTVECFERDVAKHRAEYSRKMKTKSQRGAKFHRRQIEESTSAIEPARTFWGEVERISKASGIKAAQEAQDATLNALRELVGRIVLYQEATITGLVIKAQAMQAWSHVDGFNRAFHSDAVAWADEMTATILRRTSEAA